MKIEQLAEYLRSEEFKSRRVSTPDSSVPSMNEVVINLEPGENIHEWYVRATRELIRSCSTSDIDIDESLALIINESLAVVTSLYTRAVEKTWRYKLYILVGAPYWLRSWVYRSAVSNVVQLIEPDGPSMNEVAKNLVLDRQRKKLVIECNRRQSPIIRFLIQKVLISRP